MQNFRRGIKVQEPLQKIENRGPELKSKELAILEKVEKWVAEGSFTTLDRFFRRYESKELFALVRGFRKPVSGDSFLHLILKFG